MSNIYHKLTKTEIYVRYYETDRMKIVHHSNYFRYYELARCDFFSQKVISYSILEERYFVLSPLVSAYSEFYKPLGFEDVFSVITFIQDFDGIRVVFGYLGIYGRNDLEQCSNLLEEYLRTKKKFDALVCFGSTEHVFVDARSFKPIRIKVFIKEKGDSLYNLIKGMRL